MRENCLFTLTSVLFPSAFKNKRKEREEKHVERSWWNRKWFYWKWRCVLVAACLFYFYLKVIEFQKSGSGFFLLHSANIFLQLKIKQNSHNHVTMQKKILTTHRFSACLHKWQALLLQLISLIKLNEWDKNEIFLFSE